MKIVLLPGLDGTGQLFEYFVSRLPASLAPIVLSYPVNPTLGYEELVRFVRRSCPKNESYIVLGESFSGPIAIKVASLSPPGLCAVILVNTFVASPNRLVMSVIDSFPLAFSMSVATPLLKIILQEREPDVESVELVTTVVNSLPRDLVKSRLAAIQKIDVRAAAAAIEVPVLVLRARSDVMVPMSATAQLVEALGADESHTLPGNHFLLQTFPSAAIALIVRLLHDAALIVDDEA